MSGIAGIIDFNQAPIERERIVAMTSALAHRGPDGISHWFGRGVALGHGQLHTTPESLAEHQPLASEDAGLVLVMDGRLDNWQELRERLLTHGAVLRDRSDAELVLRAYQAWGPDCLAHLDGDFALAIWDADRRRAFCARDRMGRKPFTYHWDGTRLTFASELHPILAMPWVPRSLNEGLLAEYLQLEWHSREDTPWTGVQRLPAAHRMEVGPGTRTVAQYWQPDLHTPIVYATDEQYVEHYRHLLTDAVRRSSRSHRPLACEVSGGLDSSAVFAVAVDLERRHRLPAPGVSGFTLRFEGDSAANELDFARAVGAHVGVPVAEIAPTSPPLAWYEAWAHAYLDFPGYPNGIMGLGIRQAAQEGGARVLLAGGGGDEWLAGTRDDYVEEIVAREWGHLHRSLRADARGAGVGNASRRLGRSAAVALLPPFVLEALRARRQRRRDAGASPGRWLSPHLADVLEQRAASTGHAPRRASFPRAGQAALSATLHAPYDALAHESEERLAASLGIELRLPLATAAMVQFAFSTPDRLRVQGETIKALHRRAMRDLLPERVLERQSKADFMVTFRHHADALRGALTPVVRQGLEIWVQRPELDAACERYGDPASDGVAEWRLWSLFGWSLLRSSAG